VCTKPPIFSDNGPEAFSFINSWLGDCYNNHEKCRKTVSGVIVDEVNGPPLPTRVVDVGNSGSDRVCLVQSQGRRGNYFALSYCWGSDQQHLFTTTLSTLNNRLSGIEIERLPKTYRDAIVVTRALGARYLWIDALCIIQDDQDDWKRESSRMADVYQNAQLIIAASGASNPGEGCFSRLQRCAEFVEIPHYDAAGCRSGSICVTPAVPGFYSPSFGPLIERGWAMQEWYLARRTLHFMPSGLSWKCRAGKRTRWERYPYKMAQYSCWKWVIESFSEQKLTFHTDRLVAIQGMASAICAAKGDRYLFGVFESNLLEQLLWMVDSLAVAGEDLAGVPSWSWAAKGGPKVVWSRRAIPWMPVVTRCDVKIEESGALKVRGPVAECRTIGETTGNESKEDSKCGSEEGSESEDGRAGGGGCDSEWLKIADLARLMRRDRRAPLGRIVSSHREPRILGVAAVDFEGANASHMIILARSTWKELTE
jgi:hypothetical protein